MNIIKPTYQGSAWLCAMWSLVFLSFMCLSCKNSSEDSDMERLSAEIYGMHTCQIKADNINFYLHKYNAEKLLDKYEEEEASLTEKNRHAFLLSRGRYSIVYSDYLLQIGNKKEAIKVIDKFSQDKLISMNVDTLLWLNYLSHQGSVNYFRYNLTEHRKNIEKGYDCLVQCYILASRNNKDMYKAVSMQLLSQYLLNDSIFQIVRQFDPASVRYLNEDGVADSLLAGNLAEKALGIFLNQEDFYYTANAWRSLARCYFHIGDAHNSIECLNNALANPVIDSMPDIKASISEQMSMSYAALNDKNMSDYYRNQYLDLQDSTRQDRQYEARIISLDSTTRKIWIWAAIAFVVFVVLCLLTIFLVRLRHRNTAINTQQDEVDMLSDDLRAMHIRNVDTLRAMVEQHARVYIVKGILSLIDRINNAVQRKDYTYAIEVTKDIERQNAMLTSWIRLDQGKVMPKIENVKLSDIFDIISRLTSRLATHGVTLTVHPTTEVVKADKSLTLFMLNTLIDNAQKAGARIIEVGTEEIENGINIYVSDTGRGMTTEQLEHLFDIKPIRDDGQQPSSHGFGLQNCRGIIERYRKISSTFSVCSIKAQSTLGKGTRVSFSLPIVRFILAFFFMLFSFIPAEASVSNLEKYADSLYRCNVEGRYAEAEKYADSCKIYTHNRLIVPKGQEDIYLSVYNETAVTALVMHQWHKYQYYNYLYTKLYKQTTEDATLPDYCRKKQQTEFLANISMLIVLLLIISLLPIFWFAYLHPLLASRSRIAQEKQQLRDNLLKEQREFERIHVANNIISNQLSTLKHETMYYPSRIRQLLTSACTTDSPNDLNTELLDTTSYYSQLYGELCNQMISMTSSIRTFTVSNIALSDILPTLDSTQAVLANGELLTFLMMLLKRQCGGEMPLCVVKKSPSPGNGKYITLSFDVRRANIPEEELPHLFNYDSVKTDYLVMRQIIREIVDATLAYGSGIKAVMQDGVPTILITLPKGKLVSTGL
ncbi:MAG: DUF5112 domain-containing protein [Prevotella sp.]|nr:DUF5112 domain-containing protein [Prevotella sp.]